MTTLNLRDIERKSWCIAQQDGLMDVLIGILLLTAAVGGAFDSLGLPTGAHWATIAIFSFAGVGLTLWIRKRYVVPRLGRVKFSANRVRQTRSMRVLLASCVAITVLLVVATTLARRFGFAFLWDLGDVGAWGIISFVIIVPLGGIALFLEIPRLWIYAGLFSVVEFLHIVVHFPARVPFGATIVYGIASAVALAVGITFYVRFLRRYPRCSHPAEDIS